MADCIAHIDEGEGRSESVNIRSRQRSNAPSVCTMHPLDERFSCLKTSYLDAGENAGKITVVSLCRPEKRNSVSTEMWREIGTAFHLVGSIGDNCRCVILRGAGKGFCGGIDMMDEHFLAGMDGDDDSIRKAIAFKPQILEMQAAFTAIERCQVPVVAAVHGCCIGAGMDMICCADVRVASASAVFSVREARVGLAADVGTLQRFPKLVGSGSIVREVCLTGRDFGAKVALELGFVSCLVEDDGDLMRAATDICLEICRNSPVAVACTKASLNYSRDHTVADGLEHVALMNSTALQSEDLAKAFMINSGASADTQYQPLLAHSRL